MLVLRHAKCRSHGVTEASTQISKENKPRREARQRVTGLESLQAAPGRATGKAVRVKPKLQWRPQDAGDVRNM
jgi:hypothetical protein